MKIWEVYPKLARAVWETHDQNKMYHGHPFDHTLCVGQIACLIAETDEVKRLGGAAGLCHNADRILQKILKVGKKDIAEHQVWEMVQSWFSASGEFGPSEEQRIMQAVLKHSGPNLNDGDDILVALQDADRIYCAGASEFMAAGQFRPEIPIIDVRLIADEFGDTDFKNPKSLARDLLSRKDWIDPNSKVCVRLPKAKELMGRRVAYTMAYLDEIRRQREEIGVLPNYPAGF